MSVKSKLIERIRRAIDEDDGSADTPSSSNTWIHEDNYGPRTQLWSELKAARRRIATARKILDDERKLVRSRKSGSISTTKVAFVLDQALDVLGAPLFEKE